SRRKLIVAEKVGIGARRPASDATAQLVELRQTKRIGAVYDQRVGVRDIQARFDDRGRKQYVRLAGVESMHYRGKLLFRHLPVTDVDPRFGHKLGEVHPHRVDRVDTVVY